MTKPVEVREVRPVGPVGKMVVRVFFALVIGVAVVGVVAGIVYMPEHEAAIASGAEWRAELVQKGIPNPVCEANIKCIARKFDVTGPARCHVATNVRVDSIAKHEYRWVDSMFQPDFQSMQLGGSGTITYTGDKLEFQNGFGAWNRAKYRCDYNYMTDTADNIEISVR
jgi:hypothetical protein